MTTRRAKNDLVLNQNRFASSSEFNRGLLGNLVAKRTAMLDRSEDRELVWAIQYLSHQEGGLAALAANLIADYPNHICTREMLATKKATGNFTADEIKNIRMDLPANLRREFPLKGETASIIRDLRTKCNPYADESEKARAKQAELENFSADAFDYEDIVSGKREQWENQDHETAAKHPATYPVNTLREFCLRAAKDGIGADGEYPATSSLERSLAEMCLDPKWNFEAGGPWYFPSLVDTLREYISQWSANKCRWPETKLGRILAEEFDYTWQSRCMSLLTGEARRGKTFAAKICCHKYPGRARFVEVPPGNDDTSFFRALARGLGLGNLGQYSTTDIRDRVETVLLSGDLLLVLDESQRVFPERTRYAYPSRVTWLMTMANAKVPILMISTPQFTDRQLLAEKGGWNSAQLTGRIFNYKVLPAALDDDDLMAICRAFLPEIKDGVLRGLAEYAVSSARYLAAIESITLRARYLATCAGRKECMIKDVRVALEESIIPSDTRLNLTLEKNRKQTSRRRFQQPEPLAQEATDPLPTPRSVVPAKIDSPAIPRRAAGITEFAPA